MQKFLSIENVGMEFDTKRGRFEALRNVNLPYHPLYNGLILRCGCQ